MSFRVPRELKKKMDNLREHINWSEELRRFVEKRVKEFEQEKALEELEEIIRKMPPSPRGGTTKYVREDRDSY